MSIAEKLNKVMESVGYLQQDGEVAFGRTKYNFLSEEKLTTELRQAFIEEGLVIYPHDMALVDKQKVKTKSSSSYIYTIKVKYILTDGDEKLEIVTLGQGMDSGDKGINKAMTGAFKYAERETCMIPTGDDPDHVSSAELKGKQKNKKKTKKKSKKKKSKVSDKELKARKEVIEEYSGDSKEREKIVKDSIKKFLNEGERISTLSDPKWVALSKIIEGNLKKNDYEV